MRNYKFDNIKAVLILLVVFGHMLELVNMGGLYRVIYTVHMPVFIFVSGYFAKFNAEKILKRMILPYIVFQLAYTVFVLAVINKNFDWSKVTLVRPYWIMWFMLVMIMYHLLIPFVKGFMKRIVNICLVFAVSCVLSLLAGFDSNIGYNISLGRFFTYLPYFVLGMAFRKCKLEIITKKTGIKIITFLLALIACIGVGFYGGTLIPRNALYGALSYQKGGYSAAAKALLLIIGINWCFFSMALFPNRRIPIVATIGQNTLMVYLLHGFIKLYLGKYLKGNPNLLIGMPIAAKMGLAFVVSVVIVVVLGVVPWIFKSLDKRHHLVL
jgi:fucose 4-O-acetylase-like acetyltransferase